MNLFSRFGKKKSGKSRQGRRRKRGSSRWPWLLGAALVVVVLGVGLLNWAQTRRGQATLLTLGSDKMFDDVQAAVDLALAAVLPGFTQGPATAGLDYDWPAPQLGTGAVIRCRGVAVTGDESWWAVQARIADAVAEAGALVLWGERLLPERLGRAQQQPNEQLDQLRLDIGVPGRPTHTLVLWRAGSTPRLKWGGGPGLSRWKQFAAAEEPTVALIIDDWGHGKTGPAMAIMELPAPLTMAVLPGLAYSRFFSLRGTELVLPPGRALGAGGRDSRARARQARRRAGCVVEVATGRPGGQLPTRRREIMLHLPMQPQGYPEVNPGLLPLLVGMGRPEIGQRLDAALSVLPDVTGVNNHMGSAATSDKSTMRALMAELKDRNLFFVDSMTSPRSVAYAEAVRAGVPAARNRIFLYYDDENEAAILANLERLVQSARATGFAVGIGHPHVATAAVLTREIPRLAAQGVRFVTMSELLALREFRDAMVTARQGD